MVILDMRPACSYTDYFVVCTGQNTRQTAAIYNEVHSGMKHDVRLLPSSVDGQSEASWIVADYLDVVLHIFTPESRAYYRLEDLWGDAHPSRSRPANTQSRPGAARRRRCRESAPGRRARRAPSRWEPPSAELPPPTPGRPFRSRTALVTRG